MIDLLTWFSPAFPTGGFAYSHGLEVAMNDGRIHDVDTLVAHLRTHLLHGALHNDLCLLAAAYRGEDVTDLAQSLAGSSERLEETQAQGAAMARTLNAVYGWTLPAAPFPVVAAWAGAKRQIGLEALCTGYSHAFLSNLVSVAIRFVPISQTDGQRVLAALHGDIQMAGQNAAESSLEDIGSVALMGDIDAIRHETLETRIFKT